MDDKKYEDSDGNKCTLYQMVRREPEWSASRIRVCERLETEIDELKSAMQKFIDKVESGKAHSVETYSEFKSLLNRDKGE